MRISIEIRAAEGGDDAKALVAIQAAIYRKYAERHGARAEAMTSGPG